MNEMIINDAPIVPLYYDMVVRLYPKNIKGFRGNALNLMKLKCAQK
jgi:peptide/nickel transport system substrate-binding protein